MPVTSRLPLGSYSYSPRTSCYRGSSLDRGSYLPLTTKFASLYTPSMSTSSSSTSRRVPSRPPLPSATVDFRGRCDVGARASTAPRVATFDENSLGRMTEARKYLIERRAAENLPNAARPRYCRTESRDVSGAAATNGTRSLRASVSGASGASAERRGSVERVAERVLCFESRAGGGGGPSRAESEAAEAADQRASVWQLRRQFDSAASVSDDDSSSTLSSGSQSPVKRPAAARRAGQTGAARSAAARAASPLPAGGAAGHRDSVVTCHRPGSSDGRDGGGARERRRAAGQTERAASPSSLANADWKRHRATKETAAGSPTRRTSSERGQLLSSSPVATLANGARERHVAIERERPTSPAPTITNGSRERYIIIERERSVSPVAIITNGTRERNIIVERERPTSPVATITNGTRERRVTTEPERPTSPAPTITNGSRERHIIIELERSVSPVAVITNGKRERHVTNESERPTSPTPTVTNGIRERRVTKETERPTSPAPTITNGIRERRTSTGSGKRTASPATPLTNDTSERSVSGTRERSISGTRERLDSGTRGRLDSGTRERLDSGTMEQDVSSPASRRRALLPEPEAQRRRTASSSSTDSGGRVARTAGGSTVAARLVTDFSAQGGLVGLRNIGNTCFMNSVLQCLSNTRQLHSYVMYREYEADINSTTSSMKGALVQAFADLIGDMWKKGEDSHRVLTTAPFKSHIQRFAPRFMGYQQQDAQEFLRYLLEGLHEDVNRVTARPRPITEDIDDSLSDSQKAIESWKRFMRFDNSKFVDLFVGQLKSTLRCTVCGHSSVTFDPFWDLSLPIPARTGQVRLQACFDLFNKEEVLDGDEKPTCSRCKKRQKCTKSFSIQKFPCILVVHLKRFSPAERYRGKLNCTVEFPLCDLDLSPYSEAQTGCKYNLYGVANHSGTLYSGHYSAYCRHPYSAEWHEYNDSRVRTVSQRSVVTSEAYVLFFEHVTACRV